MATFVQTTLSKRTGATTTVFNPQGINGGTGKLAASSSVVGHAPTLEISQSYNARARNTRVRVMVPQIDSGGDIITGRPHAEIKLFIPEGTLQSDVNDLVGYIESLCATGLSNLNDVLVDGEGVY